MGWRDVFLGLAISIGSAAGLGLWQETGYGQPVRVVAQAGTQHPHIHHAVKELKAAKLELESAAHDFGCHRVEAIKAIDAAIRQLEIAAKYANR